MAAKRRRRAVVAFGGNALSRADETGTQAEQARHAGGAARRLVDLVRTGYDLLIVHGNGPQVGHILIQQEEAATKVPPLPLESCVAMSQGFMGYVIECALRIELERRRLSKGVATCMTLVRVAGDDPAFHAPTKPIGPFYTRYRAQYLMKRMRWPMVEDSGRGWRKVVPSPRPIEVLNLETVRGLWEGGQIVVAGGGGGVPVARNRRGRLTGVEAVIDKDFTAALMAKELGAELLALLTSVPAVAIDYGKPSERELGAVGARELTRHLEAGEFGAGSMRPKVEAALEFLQHGGREVVITSPELLKAALRGKSGTRVHRDRFE